jgi:tripartite-type tricarboxylate transporter receptor subunit TctC
MDTGTRQTICGLMLATAVAAMQIAEAGDTYPTRPVRIVHGFSPGGMTDTLARILGEPLEARLGEAFVVEARPGGAGVLGMAAVAEATPDGYTLLLGNAAITISPNRKEKLAFDPLTAFIPVSMIGTAPSVLVAQPSLPVTSVAELISLARTRPGNLKCATSGVARSSDLAVHLLNQMAGISIQNVPYKGSRRALTAAIVNHAPISFAPVLPAIAHLKQGRLKALGVSSLKRNRLFPEVPAIAETVPGYENVGFYSIVAPRGVPMSVVDMLHRNINAVLARPAIQLRTGNAGLTVMTMTRSELAQYITRDARKWKKLVTAAELAL